MTGRKRQGNPSRPQLLGPLSGLVDRPPLRREREPLIERKGRLLRLIAKAKDGIEFNDHLEGNGAEIFTHACRLGHEGIVAKRKDLGYQSGPSKRWVKIKNPDSAAAKRIEEGSF